MEYKLLTAVFEYELEDQVNKLLAEGWSLYGHTMIVKRDREKGENVTLTDFYQAMIKGGTPFVGVMPETGFAR